MEMGAERDATPAVQDMLRIEALAPKFRVDKACGAAAGWVREAGMPHAGMPHAGSSSQSGYYIRILHEALRNDRPYL